MVQKKENSAAIGSAVARASAARLAAVQAVYQMGLNDQKAGDVIAEFKLYRLGKTVDGEDMVLPDGVLFENIMRGLDQWRAEAENLVDKALAKRNADGKVSKIEPLLRAIMLCGAYEMIGHGLTDAPIIISDYVNVARAFYEGGEPGLVNAVLDAVNKAVRE